MPPRVRPSLPATADHEPSWSSRRTASRESPVLLAAPPHAELWIVGSGSLMHNLRRVFRHGRVPAGDASAASESRAFRD